MSWSTCIHISSPTGLIWRLCSLFNRCHVESYHQSSTDGGFNHSLHTSLSQSEHRVHRTYFELWLAVLEPKTWVYHLILINYASSNLELVKSAFQNKPQVINSDLRQAQRKCSLSPFSLPLSENSHLLSNSHKRANRALTGGILKKGRLRVESVGNIMHRCLFKYIWLCSLVQ